MRTRWVSCVGMLVCTCVLWACQAPEGSTLKVSEFSQGACSKNLPLIPQSPGGTVDVKASGAYIWVTYKQAHFRCEQKVQFYVDQEDSVIKVTARPIDMNPSVVAGCDCQFDLSAKVGPFPAGNYQVEVYHKTDNYGSPSQTTKVSSVAVTLTSGTANGS